MDGRGTDLNVGHLIRYPVRTGMADEDSMLWEAILHCVTKERWSIPCDLREIDQRYICTG
jgi:hypothetical protein